MKAIYMLQKTSKRYFDGEGNLMIKPYRMVDLCKIFDVNYRTMRRWIQSKHKLIGKKRGHYYNAEQVSTMVKQFGVPCILKNS